MIHLNDITLCYGERALFDAIHCTFDQTQRVGVVGRNGAGKSTLLKVIAGIIPLDSGAISLTRGKTIAYMPQELVLLSEKNVFEETYSAFDAMIADLDELKKIEQLLANMQGTDELLDRYLHLQEKGSSYDPSKCIADTEKMLKGLGFTDETIKKQVSDLSVGWKMRVVLAKLLLQNADFYLFDEPTNHLDIVSQEWFFNFLKESKSGFMLVSHDRHYLERACSHIFEIERGNGRLFTGNFSAYVAQKEQEATLKQAAYERQQKDIKQKQATIDRFRAGTRARAAQSMIKQLDKIELIEPDPVLPVVQFQFKSAIRPGKMMLSFKNLSKSFGDRLVFKNISGMIERGEKISLIAANGVGKTTLFNVLSGLLERDHGTIEFGHNVSYALFEQDQLQALKPENTIYEEVLNAVPNVAESTMRTFLGSFLFSGDDVHKKISMLSGGERCRVALVKVLLTRANFLLLDEPTNHLDLYAKEVLLQALQQYDGTIFMVCHDHDFIERLSTSIFELTPTALHRYNGNYESYLAQKKHLEVLSSAPTVSTNQQINKSQANASTHNEIKSLESKIERLEKNIERESARFAEHEYGSLAYKQASARLEKLQKERDDLLKEWEALA